MAAQQLKDYLEKRNAPGDEEELEYWWYGCPGCESGAEGGHDLDHPAHYDQPDEVHEEFEMMRNLKEQLEVVAAAAAAQAAAEAKRGRGSRKRRRRRKSRTRRRTRHRKRRSTKRRRKSRRRQSKRR
jgi:hypothetical protein